MIVNEENFGWVIQQILETGDTVVYDTETSGLDLWGKDRQCGIGVCLEDERTFYFPFRHRVPDRIDWEEFYGEGILPLLDPRNLPIDRLPVLLETLAQFEALIAHNAKFDMTAIHRDGYYPPEEQEMIDTYCMSRYKVTDKLFELSLENMANLLLEDDKILQWKQDFHNYMKANGIAKKSRTVLINGVKDKIEYPPHYDWGDIEVVGKYCENDCLNTWRIYKVLLHWVSKTDQWDVYQQEVALTKIIWDEIERGGMYYDREYCAAKIPLIENWVTELESELYGIFKYEFDLNSAQQLGKAMKTIGITSGQFTAKGNEQWNVGVLTNLKHPVAKLVLKYREAYKMLNTYLKPYYKNWKSSWIHPSYKIAGAASGRMSCVQPNLQNVMTKYIDTGGEKELDAGVQKAMESMSKSGSVSSRWLARLQTFQETDTTAAVKRLFTAPPGFHMYAADVRQMEMTVFFDYVDDPEVKKAIEEDGFDFHAFVATQIWGAKDTDPQWKFYRSIAKAINFGMIYGIGIAKLAVQMGVDEVEATAYKKQYFERFPTAKVFMDSVKRKVQTYGYIINRFGRRYTIPSDKAYIGVNYLCQGSSADIIKNRMVALSGYCKQHKLKSRMAGQIHDELLLYIHESELHHLPRIKDLLEERAVIESLLPIDISICKPSWSEKVTVCTKCWFEAPEEKDENGNKIKHVCNGSVINPEYFLKVINGTEDTYSVRYGKEETAFERWVK